MCVFSKPLYEEKEIIFNNLPEDIENYIFEMSYQMELKEKTNKIVQCIKNQEIFYTKYTKHNENFVVNQIFKLTKNKKYFKGTTYYNHHSFLCIITEYWTPLKDKHIKNEYKMVDYLNNKYRRLILDGNSFTHLSMLELHNIERLMPFFT